MLFKVLVLAMLSSASGWGLPNNSPLSSNESSNITGGVDDARDRRHLASCDQGMFGIGACCDYLLMHWCNYGGCSCDASCLSACDGWFGTSCDSSCNRDCDEEC